MHSVICTKKPCTPRKNVMDGVAYLVQSKFIDTGDLSEAGEICYGGISSVNNK